MSKPTNKIPFGYSNAVTSAYDVTDMVKKPVSVGNIRVSLRSRRLLKPSNTPQQIETFKCISCFTPHNVFERNIRGRILRGYMVVVNGRTTIKDFHEGGGKPSPCYHNGRLCEACFPKYQLRSDAPDDYKSIQFIKDFKGPVTKRDPITLGKVEHEDALQEIALEAAQKDARPKRKGLAMDVGKVSVAPEPIHVNAFRKFMQSRRGGIKNYDMEVNFTNQKKG